MLLFLFQISIFLCVFFSVCLRRSKHENDFLYNSVWKIRERFNTVERLKFFLVLSNLLKLHEKMSVFKDVLYRNIELQLI